MNKLGLALAAAVAAAWSLAPFLWQVVVSLRPAESWVLIFRARPFARYILNSALVSGGATALCLAAGAPAAYAFARLRLPGRRLALAAALALSLLPATILVVPLKQLVQRAGLLNSRAALSVIYAGLNLPFCLWTLTTFFRKVPRELEDAAAIDGFSPAQTLLRVVLPLSAPALASTALLVFIFCWNEFLIALTLISRDLSRTVPVGIAMLSGASVYEVPWGQIAAAVVATTLPVAAAVLAFQRRIVAGLTAGAVKG